MKARESLKQEVLLDPDNAYRFYKYLENDLALTTDDVTAAPKSISYTISASPKMVKHVEVIDEQGSLINVVWWAYEEDGLTPIEEILKVSLTYTYGNDAAYPSAKTVLSRVVDRQWILENGTYKSWTEAQITNEESDIKRRVKIYPNYRVRKEVGIKRRKNIAAIGEERFITLVTIMITGGNQELAEKLGKSILRLYATEYNEFINTGDGAFMEGVMTEVGTSDLEDEKGQVIFPGVSANIMLNAVVPATVNLGQGPIPFNAIVPSSEGLSIREYLSNKYKGLI